MDIEGIKAFIENCKADTPYMILVQILSTLTHKIFLGLSDVLIVCKTI